MLKIFHNPRCSKSRQALDLIEARNKPVEIIKYLETPPNIKLLSEIITLLDISPRDLLRKGEQAYKDLNLKDANITDDVILEAMVSHPKLIERPIVFNEERAILGRPPENILPLLVEE